MVFNCKRKNNLLKIVLLFIILSLNFTLLSAEIYKDVINYKEHNSSNKKTYNILIYLFDPLNKISNPSEIYLISRLKEFFNIYHLKILYIKKQDFSKALKKAKKYKIKIIIQIEGYNEYRGNENNKFYSKYTSKIKIYDITKNYNPIFSITKSSIIQGALSIEIADAVAFANSVINCLYYAQSIIQNLFLTPSEKNK